MSAALTVQSPCPPTGAPTAKNATPRVRSICSNSPGASKAPVVSRLTWPSSGACVNRAPAMRAEDSTARPRNCSESVTNQSSRPCKPSRCRILQDRSLQAAQPPRGFALVAAAHPTRAPRPTRSRPPRGCAFRRRVASRRSVNVETYAADGRTVTMVCARGDVTVEMRANQIRSRRQRAKCELTAAVTHGKRRAAADGGHDGVGNGWPRSSRTWPVMMPVMAAAICVTRVGR